MAEEAVLQGVHGAGEAFSPARSQLCPTGMAGIAGTPELGGAGEGLCQGSARVQELLAGLRGPASAEQSAPRRARERESRAVQALVGRLMARVRESDPRLFTGEALLVGSQAQGPHVQAESSCSDYDFLAPIHYRTPLLLLGSLYSKLFSPKSGLPAGDSTGLPVPVHRWGNKVVVDYSQLLLGDLLERPTTDPHLTAADVTAINRQHEQLSKSSITPYTVMSQLWDSVQAALVEEERDPAAGISNLRLENMVGLTPISPAVQLSLEVDGRAVSIDLVPTIRGKVDMSLEWPRQDLSWLSAWEDQERGTVRGNPPWNVEEIYGAGTDLVAKNSYWRLTFSLAETQLLADIDADGGRRRALRVLKQVNTKQWAPRYGKVLTSYHLKMVLFWASYLYPEPQAWATGLDALGTLLKVLEFSLETRQLPSYFLPSLNFFAWHRTKEENALRDVVLEVLWREVRLMRCSPEQYLWLSYGLAQPRGPEPFLQRARELDAVRAEHRQDFEELKHLKLSFDTSVFSELDIR